MSGLKGVRKESYCSYSQPCRVTLTSITLHYYSDSQRGLPPLALFAVPDYFEPWGPIHESSKHVDIDAVPPGKRLGIRRYVNLTVDFNSTTKVLMITDNDIFYEFSLCEVEFRECKNASMYICIIRRFLYCLYLQIKHQNCIFGCGTATEAIHIQETSQAIRTTSGTYTSCIWLM